MNNPLLKSIFLLLTGLWFPYLVLKGLFTIIEKIAQMSPSCAFFLGKFTGKLLKLASR